MLNPLTYFSAAQRQNIYLGYASVGIVLGAIMAAFGALSMALPEWLVATQAVYGYVGTATNLVAAANVTPDATIEEADAGLEDVTE